MQEKTGQIDSGADTKWKVSLLCGFVPLWCDHMVWVNIASCKGGNHDPG